MAALGVHDQRLPATAVPRPAQHLLYLAPRPSHVDAEGLHTLVGAQARAWSRRSIGAGAAGRLPSRGRLLYWERRPRAARAGSALRGLRRRAGGTAVTMRHVGAIALAVAAVQWQGRRWQQRIPTCLIVDTGHRSQRDGIGGRGLPSCGRLPCCCRSLGAFGLALARLQRHGRRWQLVPQRPAVSTSRGHHGHARAGVLPFAQRHQEGRGFRRGHGRREVR
mmetsp:Transcript_121309/g.343705  ORF Transcript_121309/g.343705 Transcript_121309/m.343705 type:complete len:221 (-) Transcript_121309:269-931(-)